MSYQVPAKELAALWKCPPTKRYQYFLNKVSDWGEVWSIRRDDGWALLGDDSNLELVPVWPAKAFAEGCCADDWSDHDPAMIPTKDFVEKWLPGMLRDGRKLAVFNLPSGEGIIMAPDQVLNDIQGYLDNITDNDSDE